MRKANVALVGGLVLSFMGTSPLLTAGQLNTKSGKPLDVLVGDVKTWKQLHSLHREYPMDDGAVAEEYSEFVVSTLAKHWNTLQEMETIAKRDPAFEKFVLEHIDSTTDTDELKAVVRNATKHCPTPGSRKLCAKIAAAAKAALASM